jgi:hypothetical protein
MYTSATRERKTKDTLNLREARYPPILVPASKLLT